MLSGQNDRAYSVCNDVEIYILFGFMSTADDKLIGWEPIKSYFATANKVYLRSSIHLREDV